MKMTYPLKDLKDIEEVKEYLSDHSIRNFLMFMVGISSALRISDILKLRVLDVYDGRRVREHIELKEKKTGKTKIFKVSRNLEKSIRKYIAEYNPGHEDYLFVSREGENKPMTRQRAVQILDEALDACGLGHITFGSHGMRKTFSYHLWKNGIDISYIMRLLNHSSQKETLRYLTVEQSELDDIVYNLNL